MKTQLLKIDSDSAEQIHKVAQVLRQGGIVAIPTETVYGLAARAYPDTLAHLDTIKERLPGKRYTLHIGDKTDLDSYVPAIPAPARKLSNITWPGPMTLIFELNQDMLKIQQKKLNKEIFDILYPDGTIGIRCPNLPLCSQILRTACVPVVAPSANPSSQPPATSTQQVMEYFDGKIEMIVDGGQDACKHKKSSAVVKFGASGIEVLREGIYENKDITKMTTIRILFVCTGNSCRSPMAEALCKKIISDKFGCSIDELPNFGYIIESAGIAAIEGLTASAEAEIVCREYGVSIAGHQSRQLTPQRIAESDLIFVMSRTHLRACNEMAGCSENRIQLLDDKKEVSDPIGRGLDVYRECADQMFSVLKERIDDFL